MSLNQDVTAAAGQETVLAPPVAPAPAAKEAAGPAASLTAGAGATGGASAVSWPGAAAVTSWFRLMAGALPS